MDEELIPKHSGLKATLTHFKYVAERLRECSIRHMANVNFKTPEPTLSNSLAPTNHRNIYPREQLKLIKRKFFTHMSA